MSNWHQTPAPGSHRICLCGDSLTVTLFSNPPREGTAWLRTNLGHARHRRREIIEHVEHHAPLLVRDWHDLPMTPGTSPGVFEIRIPLFETGRFEAKAFFLPDREDSPLWPEGENLVIKVEPSDTICANSVYTAFVRQFGPNMRNAVELPIPPETLATLDGNGCTVIPKSGTFRALTAQLDHIIGTLGFRIIQLLPIHPVPTTFARMGRFGSPFASIDFFNVDPALAEFDRKSTPLDQFAELVDGVHQRHATLFIDLPINHTGWASHLQLHHPDWFARNGDQSFASPGAWGITWEDLSELDYRHRGLWEYMAKVFLFWCAHGVDGFRCDAGYMVPLPVWEYIVAKVRQSYPDTIFLLEGLGGKISVMRDLLDRANLNWAYSEIFQVYDRGHLEQELQQYHLISNNNGTLINFAETHDNNRLAAHSQAYARMRTALVALCSESGAFGITNGVEWFAEAKVDVHGAPPLNWDNPVNQIDHIHRINQLLKGHPAFCAGTRHRILPSHTGVLQLLREPPQGSPVLSLINLDLNQPADAIWPESNFAPINGKVFDLLGGSELAVDSPSPGTLRLSVAPGAAFCLGDPNAQQVPPAMLPPSAVTRQRLSAMAMALHARLVSHILPTSYNAHDMARALAVDPIAFCESISGHCALKSVTVWQWPVDLYRCVMLPSEHALFIQSPYPFRAALDSPLTDGQPTTASSLPLADGTGHFAFLLTENQCSSVATLPFKLTVYTPEGVKHANTGILQLPGGPERQVELRFGREALRESRRCALLTNGAGSMSQVRLEWGRIVSQYDCMLAINTDPRVPVDRRILLTRCRAWLLHKGYSYEIGIDCTTNAAFIPGESAHWSFDIPAGLGKSVPISFELRLCRNRNHILFDITRHRATHSEHLADEVPVTLILRPDIEDRCFHESTKAYSGPEYQWPHAISTHEHGFRFDPGGHAAMRMETDKARFSRETEWLYGIPHPFEADRGLEPNGDLFSPGFFSFELNGASQQRVEAFLEGEPEAETLPPLRLGEVPHHLPIEQVLISATRDFIVRRDDSRTVIAGYPWFLDWGRDTLICLRGIIAAGMLEEARDILIQFARFEDRGTLPNMIRGNDDRNRDTSDAPLWFFTACNDLLLADPANTTFLHADCKGRPLRAVLRSLAEHMIAGTPNGIKMDPTSSLIFSPSHFTWMDTNYPAGTPREGYPIEIQSLWYAALQLLAKIDDQRLWQPITQQVRQSIETLYRLPDRRYLADCLHAQPGTPAAKAVADNALRPNQLLAVTLGAIDNPELVRGILNATARLLIPGAIRSLADQPVSPPLPIHGSHGLLNDPGRPYWGEYRGDEDTRRKPAYHNGTAWTWPFPSYCEALAIHDAALIPTARSLLSSICELMHEGCVGHLPEILDGNLPHHQRGCWAQAWGATEALRVLKRLTRK
ncbi:MAG TPA: glycogen debranching protein [Verrucomicrobia bacterium]|nr:glycogen debranching protein [Verrucomicrobiota bacterium]